MKAILWSWIGFNFAVGVAMAVLIIRQQRRRHKVVWAEMEQRHAEERAALEQWKREVYLHLGRKGIFKA
jgi:uncharacterized membrane-anchored protein YhcB (DUF1043 family)